MSDAIQAALNQIITGAQSLKELLGKSEVNMTNYAPPEQTDRDTFEQLKALVMSDKWPVAVNKSMIVDINSETQKLNRGRGIVQLMIEEDLSGRRFLDFGCGEGHCAFIATESGTELSVGYDIAKHPHWDEFEKKPNLSFIDQLSHLESIGKFDVITIFDVIDHAKGNPIDLLKTAKNLLAPGGYIYLRTHPFLSRHATHMYPYLNKAYLHLVFSPEEIQELVPDAEPIHNVGVMTPIHTYSEMIKKAGLNIVSKSETNEPVEAFFKLPIIADRIMKKVHPTHTKFPEFQLGVQFLDWKLSL